MATSEDPAEIVRAVCAGVSRLVSGDLDPAQRETQLDRLAALYAERTDVRHPFAPGGGPILSTRTEVRRHFAQAPGRADDIQRFEPVILHVHRTADPEAVITEYRYEGSAGGRPVSITNILVTRVRDGVIIESRDYADHIAPPAHSAACPPSPRPSQLRTNGSDPRCEDLLEPVSGCEPADRPLTGSSHGRSSPVASQVTPV